MTPPVLVEALRGGMVESRHRGSFAVVDATGRLVLSAGCVEAPFFPRSAAKPLQALPLIESGAADAFGLTNREIALACASHRGEPGHVEAVGTWLAGIGFDDGDLECGADAPVSQAAAANLAKVGGRPSTLHHQCSGKHAGFLSTARHLGLDPRGYIQRDHPIQKQAAAVLSEMTGTDLDAAPCGCDGCGIPTFGVPLAAFARGMARLSDRSGLGPLRELAARKVLDAMAAEPFFVEGTGGFVTDCMTVAGSSVRLKSGAEGVYAAALPGLGYGVAIKIEDGSMRAAELVMASLLDALGCLDDEQRHLLQSRLQPTLLSAAGCVVGSLRVTPAVSRDCVIGVGGWCPPNQH